MANFGNKLGRGTQGIMYVSLLTEPRVVPGFILSIPGNSLHFNTLNLPNLTKPFSFKMTAWVFVADNSILRRIIVKGKEKGDKMSSSGK